jgi:DNA-binding LacI/PurR family transcriptional regulator
VATIYDVARRADVSIGTVSRYLNDKGYVGEKARERIKKAIEELGFRPSSIARGLTHKRSYMLGFVVSDLLNPFIPEIVRSAQDFADEAGYCLLIYNTDGNGPREARALKLLYERRVDGLIITPPETKEGNRTILELHTLGIPIVLVGRSLKGVAFDRVTTDTYTGAIDAVTHLAALGHTRIAFIGGERARGLALGRYQGYLDGLQKIGLPIDERLIIETPLTRESGAEAISRLFEMVQQPTGIFAANDISAIGAMQEVMRRGKQVPTDLSIVGFDDIALAAQTLPPLTTIAQPKALLGQTAVELLLARIEQVTERTPQEIRLPCELVVRGSTTTQVGVSMLEGGFAS